MADNNKNQDWEKHRHRFGSQNDEYNNQENNDQENIRYGQQRSNSGQSNVHYGNSEQGGNMSSGYSGSQYGNQRYGSQNDYGSQGGSGSHGRYDSQRYGNSYGNTGSSYNQGSDESQFGSGYGNKNDWNRNEWQGNSNYGNQQNDWRRNTGSGYGSQGYSGSNYGNYGSGGSSNYGRRDYNQGDYNQNRERNIYGGDERNYGNANQGAFDRDWWQRTKDEVSSWFGDSDAERRRRVDRQVSGGHKGKGPKDYKRSEDRIREDVCDRLADDDMLDATHITVQVEGTEVILTGNVNSRDQKRRAEDLVDSISGVRNVENRLKVQRNDDDDDRTKWPRANADEPR